MLRLLSGRDHQVMTGFTVRRGSTVLTQTEVSHIFFRPWTREKLMPMWQQGEPLDKAGAYGIQGLAALFVTRLEGDFYNVMGLPLCALAQQLRKLGVRILGVRGCEETFEFQSESGSGSDGGPGCGLGPHRGLRPPEGSQTILTPLRAGATGLTRQAQKLYSYIFRYEALGRRTRSCGPGLQSWRMTPGRRTAFSGKMSACGSWRS